MMKSWLQKFDACLRLVEQVHQVILSALIFMCFACCLMDNPAPNSCNIITLFVLCKFTSWNLQRRSPASCIPSGMLVVMLCNQPRETPAISTGRVATLRGALQRHGMSHLPISSASDSAKLTTSCRDGPQQDMIHLVWIRQYDNAKPRRFLAEVLLRILWKMKSQQRLKP